MNIEQAIKERRCHGCGKLIKPNEYHYRNDQSKGFYKNYCTTCVVKLAITLITKNNKPVSATNSRKIKEYVVEALI